LAEEVLYNYRQKMPIVIVRPSNVVWPIKGQPGGMKAEDFIDAAMNGSLQTIYCKKHNHTRMTPLDFAVNAALVAAHKRTQVQGEQILFYNCTDDEENLLKSHELINAIGSNFVSHKQLYWFPNLRANSNFFMHIIHLYLFQLLPAFLIDAFRTLLGKKRL